jgi:hypothetical protein
VLEDILPNLRDDEETKGILYKIGLNFERFWKQNRKYLSLPSNLDEATPLRFAQYIGKYIDFKYRGRTKNKFKPYYLLKSNFFDTDFCDFLRENGWIK